MRVARAFFTSLTGRRKKFMADGMHHPSFNNDAELMLQVYSVSDSTRQMRHNTLQRVRTIIESAFGTDFSVLDRSLYQYSRDIDCAPLELTVIDTKMPNGIPPGHATLLFQDAYSHEALAKLFQGHGFSGCFIAGDAMRNQPPIDPNTTHKSFTVADHGPNPIAHPWPTYTPYPTRHLTCPPVLWVHSAPAFPDIMPFYLSPPAPTHVPLLRLLQAYTSMGSNFRDLITFIFLWTRSIDMTEMTPTCVALMVIGWLQHRKVIPSLQNPKNKGDMEQLAESNDGIWCTDCLPTEQHADSKYSSIWLKSGFVAPHVVKQPNKMGALLHEFFSFWRLGDDNPAFISSQHYISVREGDIASREKKVAKRVLSVLERDDQVISTGSLPSVDNQPTMWQSQPIVIQDPFIPSFNHAQTISKVAGAYFHHWCFLSARNISQSNPMTAVFGTKLPLPIRLPHRSHTENYATASVSQEMEAIYKASIPPKSILHVRQKTIARVQLAISKTFGNEYRVENFGSTRYGVSTATSDLDLVIIDKRNVNGFPLPVNPRRLPPIYNVWSLARALTNFGFVDVVVIPKAKVPIVKFRDSNLECDLNINESLGLWNTKLIAKYCDLAPNLLRPLIVVIKRWAKSHGMNDPSGSSGPAGFSSYALVLMLIGYLQVQGVLPSLQAGLDPLPDNPKQGVFWLRSDARESLACDIRFTSGSGWTPQAQLSLEEAFLGWVTFWSREFCWEKNLISIREGGLILRDETKSDVKEADEGAKDLHVESASDAEENVEEVASGSGAHQPSKWKNDMLVIADPFIRSKNVCGNIGRAMGHKFRAECRRCVELLEWGADLESLMGVGDVSSRGKLKRVWERKSPQGKRKGVNTASRNDLKDVNDQSASKPADGRKTSQSVKRGETSRSAPVLHNL